MTEEQKLPSDPGAALHLVDVDDAVEALDRKGAAIVTLSGFVVLLTAWVLFVAEGPIALIITLTAFLMLKKAIREYLALTRQRRVLEAEVIGDDNAPRTADPGPNLR